ncbi:MAG TPA: DUF1080 domain-containing protein [Gemmatimonadota bacterium]|jgi:hypothetical protein
MVLAPPRGIATWLSVSALALAATTGAAFGQELGDWPIHSLDRPQPPVVDPGPPPGPSPPPSDAVVLFDGTDLSRWRAEDGGPAPWRVVEGAIEVVPHTGSLVTRDSFGDVQLHVEWRTPPVVAGEGQERGNSGVYLMGLYELQVLDSHDNPTYPDGQAGAIFGQYPPLVNASRGPGEWQSYDVVFHAPRFDDTGALLAPARMTAFHNGVLIQDDVALTGPTAFQRRPPYEAHPPRLPITLQDHEFPVRYRNVWLREIGGR